jgi:hypothetical protein
MMTSSSTTKPADYEEICKKIHEIHREQSGKQFLNLLKHTLKHTQNLLKKK